MPLVPMRRPPRRRSSQARTLIRAAAPWAGAALLASAGALGKRFGAGRLLGFGSEAPAAESGSTPVEPIDAGPSNYDVGGPPANTATAVPVPPPMVPDPVDEEAEIASAAAEAAAIGGDPGPYASSIPGEPLHEEEIPLAEAGGGVAEGGEQAEAALVDAAEPFDTASPYQQQIEEIIEAQDNPYVGERAEAMDAAGQSVDFDQPGDDLGASATGASSTHEYEEPEPGGSSERQDQP